MSKREISNANDIIDGRDLLKRIGELEAETSIESNADAIKSFHGYTDDEWEACNQEKAFQAWNKAEGAIAVELEELETLRSFRDEIGEQLCRDGVSLINEEYFQTYAEEFANDIGAINSQQPWPCNCIDWIKAADELLQDYIGADYDGTTFYFRE